MDSDYACRLRLIRFALIALLRVCSINLPSNNRNGGDELSVGITVTSNVSYNQFIRLMLGIYFLIVNKSHEKMDTLRLSVLSVGLKHIGSQ